MPVYMYGCTACGLEMEISHAMSEVAEDCPICKAEKSLEKIPAMFTSKYFKEVKLSKPGSLVDEFIRDSKKELKDYKKDLKDGKI